ncbi:MAG: FecR domain-containing protein [Candidatus Riflebacteria bacterium]|nr:FecR domain-containing protein [Candidatus Riflebacteria bacterium]
MPRCSLAIFGYRQPGALRTVVSGLLLLLFASALGCGRREAQPAAELTAVTGSVNVNSQPAQVGRSLVLGDLIELAPGSRGQVVFTDGARVELLGEAGQGTSLKLAYPVTGALATTLELGRGTLSMFVPKGVAGQTRYEVETANCTTSIEGTVFLVSALGAKTRVLVADGGVKVANPLGAVTVSKGFEAVARDGEAPVLLAEPYDVREGPGKVVEDLLENSKHLRSLRDRDFRPRGGQ